VTHFDDVGACSAGETNPTHVSSSILSEQQVAVLRTTLADRIIAVCFGSGVDSTAMLVAMHEAQLRPHVLTFADTGGEKPETLHHLAAMNRVLAQWDWPQIDVCRKVPMASTGYEDLYGNCLENQTLPSLAFGMKSCSLKWKKNSAGSVPEGA
jgi:3'-phosphoadenosine 5'-phosphosulfate sulfotransferase (PAPS reductase)/FAD synthetase